MGYGESIKAARKRAGLTQAELAKKCGLALITIGQYERNLREPRREQLAKLASALGVSFGELVSEEPSTVKGLGSGLVTPNDVANEMGISPELVWKSITEPDTIPEDLRKKIGAVANLIGLENEQPENRLASGALREISYSLHQLNSEGQAVAVERVRELTEISKYRRSED